jgi:two-component system sensor histidine kinase/response regulator
MTANFVPATIMIIDDEPENLNVLGDMLRGEGWGVQAFPDGAMALAAAAESVPDLVLLDIRMPGMNGYEVCRRLKADDRLREIPIIFLSALSDTADKVRAFEVGGEDYVTKPFAEVEVLARARLHLELSRHQRHLEELVRERVADLAEAHRRLRIWDHAKTQWLGMLSHEMRTPLQGVCGIAELLFAEMPQTNETHALLDGYRRARARIVKLVEDADTLTSLDVGAESCPMTSVLLTPLLHNAIDAASALAPDVPIHASFAAIEGVTVLGTPDLIDRAFSDLLATATRCVHAHEPVTLDTGIVAREVRISIATAGRSLSSDALETFFAVGGQRILIKGGADFGLGPALVSRIVQLFNGRISVRNGTERGIVIELWLPLDPGCAPAEGSIQ